MFFYQERYLQLYRTSYESGIEVLMTQQRKTKGLLHCKLSNRIKQTLHHENEQQQKTHFDNACNFICTMSSLILHYTSHMNARETHISPSTSLSVRKSSKKSSANGGQNCISIKNIVVKGILYATVN